MHWTLPELREMAFDEYRELLEWASKRNKDQDSLDMDAVIEAKANKDANRQQ
jgi:hypothetical protein